MIDLWDFFAVRGCVRRGEVGNTYIARASNGSAVHDEAEFMRKSGNSSKNVNAWINGSTCGKM